MTIGSVPGETNSAYVSNAPAVYIPAEAAGATFYEAFEASAARSVGRTDLDVIFEAAGRRYNLPPKLLKAVAKVESDFRPNATSRVGAMGIMQLMPGTAKYLGVTDAYDPEQNIMGGARYLREMLDKYDGDINLALAAYNAGPGTIGRNGGVPLQSQMQGYIPKVLGYYYGGDINAGIISYNGSDRSETSGGTNGLFNFNEMFSQMMLIKIIEMQMSSPGDDKERVF